MYRIGRLTIILKDNMDIDESILELLSFFTEKQVSIRHFNFLNPSLEQIYLKYVEGGHQ